MSKYVVMYTPIETDARFGGDKWRTGSFPMSKDSAELFAEALKKKKHNLVHTKVVEVPENRESS